MERFSPARPGAPTENTYPSSQGACPTMRRTSLVVSSSNKLKQQTIANASEVSLPLPEIGIFYDFTEEASHDPDAVDSQKEPIGEFEDIKLEDFWDDAEKDELALILQRAKLNMSYKKKLRKAFTSKLRSSKNRYEQVSICYRCLDGGSVSSVEMPTSSVSHKVLHSNALSAQDSYDSDWEIV